MKTEIFTLIFMLFSIVAASAQTFYYTQNRTFTGQDEGTGNTFTYRNVVEPSTLARLQNAENIFTSMRQTGLTKRIIRGIDQVIEPDGWTHQAAREAVDMAFNTLPAEHRERLRGDRFSVSLIIDSNTGEVKEVAFSFLADDPVGTVPVSIFRQAELNLKNSLWFQPTELGRQLNYLWRGWRHQL
jgi:hypothetical protein